MRAAHVLAIDPGAARPGCACAWFAGGALQGARFEDFPFAPCGPLVVVVERPEYQGARTQLARPQDLMALAWAGARAAGHALGTARGAGIEATLVELTPSAWKGTTPKPVHHARLWSVLAPDERRVLGGDATYAAIARAVDAGAASRWSRPGVAYYPRAWTMHNLLDASALGMYHLSRMAK